MALSAGGIANGMGASRGQQAPAETVDRSIFISATVTIRDTYCRGNCKDQSSEECTTSTQLVFPYRGVYVRHVSKEQVVAEANQVLFFNAHEGYRVSHPVWGGDASLTLVIDQEQLRELSPKSSVNGGSALTFRRQRLRLDAKSQVLLARLRHRLNGKIAEPLEAESLALALAQQAVDARTSRAAAATFGRQRLVDRAKLVLTSDLARRWTLAAVGAAVRVSPVYLTQVFQQVEGMPLYRYQLRLRLARALDLLPHYDDLTSLSLDLGFSSHSHFSAAFRQAYGMSPSDFRHVTSRR